MARKKQPAKRVEPVELEPPPLYLRGWLEFFGLGPTKAAKIAGCEQSYISNLKSTARANPSAAILYRLSEHIGVTVNDLYHPAPSRAGIGPFADYSDRARKAIFARLDQLRSKSA